MSKLLDKALWAVAYDDEAYEMIRAGWKQEPDDHGREVWVRHYPGGYIGTVLMWSDGEVTFVVEDENGRTITGGKTNCKGSAMDACEIEAPQSH